MIFPNFVLAVCRRSGLSKSGDNEIKVVEIVLRASGPVSLPLFSEMSATPVQPRTGGLRASQRMTNSGYYVMMNRPQTLNVQHTYNNEREHTSTNGGRAFSRFIYYMMHRMPFLNFDLQIWLFDESHIKRFKIGCLLY